MPAPAQPNGNGPAAGLLGGADSSLVRTSGVPDVNVPPTEGSPHGSLIQEQFVEFLFLRGGCRMSHNKYAKDVRFISVFLSVGFKVFSGPPKHDDLAMIGKITLTCIWLPGQDPDVDPPLVALRSDQQHERTLWPDELQGFLRRHRPEWQEVRVMGWEPAPIVLSVEIDLEMPVLCRCCNQTAPVKYVDDDFVCASCAGLPTEIRQQMIDENRAKFPEN
jgi:hypothetical protein